MNVRIPHLAILALLGGVVACAGPHVHENQPRETIYYPTGFNPEKDPYWEDPRWDETLLDAIQAAVHDPADPTATIAPGIHGTVRFTYLDGVIEYPGIVNSTGNPNLDKLMLHQVASVQVPQPTVGLQINAPHQFVLDLDMPTTFELFQSSVYAAIDRQKVYPRDAVIEGLMGTTTIDFDYEDGEATNIIQTKSSDSGILDRASLDSLTKAMLPAPPPAYAGKLFHMEVQICYALGTNNCPSGMNVIQVRGWRIRRTG